jgi:AraC family transcriptional regulator of adaptative response / DNA-3-methyladenine glycosylase II
MIRQGFLNENSVRDLAETLGISARHLSRLFRDNIGIPPVRIATYHKVMFARKLLFETDLNITHIALASGFGSIRQFNDAFHSTLGISPSRIRKEMDSNNISVQSPLKLRLYYRPPFNWEEILIFMRPRLIPGVEYVGMGRYMRSFRLEGNCHGWFEVKDNPEHNLLELNLSVNGLEKLMAIVQRVRNMFDLDLDPMAVEQILSGDERLKTLVSKYPGMRIPGAWDPFEFSIRAILGQQISVKGASTLAGRIAGQYGKECSGDLPGGITRFFPDPEELKDADFSKIGLTEKRRETLAGFVKAVLDEHVSLDRGQDIHSFIRSFTCLKGIGNWTAHYVAMRALRMPDAFPHTDLGIKKALSRNGKFPGPSEVLKIAERWRPWRAYGALYLWKKLQEERG